MKHILLFCGLLALTKAYPSYVAPVHQGVGAIFKGPSSETIIKGPDGSVITSAAIGAEVAVDGHGLAVAPVVPLESVASVAHVSDVAAVSHLSNIAAVGAPGLIHADLSLGQGLLGPQTVVETSVTKLGPAVFQENPIIVEDIALIEKDPKITEEHVVVGDKIITVPKQVQENSDLVGPSGTISIRGGDAVISGPASTTIKGGGVVASIDKQPDVKVNTIELKPVVAPAIIEPVAKIIKPAPLITGEKTIITTGPVVTQAKPLLPQVYAPTAPVLAADPLLGTKIIAGPLLTHPPSIIRGGPVLNAGLHPGVVLENNPILPPHLGPPQGLTLGHIGPHLPLYRGPLH